MLTPTKMNQAYLVTFYNKDVRALVKENRRHTHFEDHWADCHTHDVVAHDEAEARSILAIRYPPEDGFVIEKVVQAVH